MSEKLLLTEPKPKRSDAVENYQLLLDTAKHLIAEQGCPNVSMSALAEAAGVGKGTVYRHFPKGKVELIQALLDQDQRDMQERTFAHLRNGGDPLADMRWFVHEVFAFVLRSIPLLSMDGDARPRSLLDHPAQFWWRMTLHGLIARANPQLDADYLADVLYVMLDASTISFQRDMLGYSEERIEESIVALVGRLVVPR